MSRLLQLVIVSSLLANSVGCAICCHPYDYAYGYVGGRWTRDNLECGRVGSAFDPAGSQVTTSEDVIDSAEPVPTPAPKPASPPVSGRAPSLRPAPTNPYLPLE